MSVHEGVQVQVYVFLTSEPDGGERSASRHSHLTPAKEPVILIGFGPRAALNVWQWIKFFSARNRTTLPGFSIRILFVVLNGSGSYFSYTKSCLLFHNHHRGWYNFFRHHVSV